MWFIPNKKWLPYFHKTPLSKRLITSSYTKIKIIKRTIGILKPGWLFKTTEEQRGALSVALAGFYGIGSVDLVRERIENCFEKEFLAYDVTQQGLVAWPDSSYNDEVVYDLERKPVIRPTPSVLASRYQMPVVNTHELMFSETPILWKEWVEWWGSQSAKPETPRLSQSRKNLLPKS